MEDVKVTVLMPAYNVEKYIGESIDSILRQSFTDFELVIVNDCSSDDTEAVIRSYSDPRIVLINQSNQGISAALNAGLLVAKGKYIARMDSDDICVPERLQLQYDFLEQHPDYVLAGTDSEYMDKDGEYLYRYANFGHSYEEICRNIELGCPFIHTSVFYKKEVVVRLGGYELKAHLFEDYLLWTKVIREGKAINFETPLVTMRLNPTSLTVDEKLRGKRFAEIKREFIFGGRPITDEQEAELIGILKSQNFSRFKQYGYYSLVAKKCLWNNHQPGKARRHAWKAVRLKPLQPMGYVLFLLSFLPQKTLRYLHQKSKS